MFCDGECTKKNKKCGLFTTLTFQKGQEEVKTIEDCVFTAILNSQLRQEKGNVRLQAAIESMRNEETKSSQNVNDTIAKGFIGLIKSNEAKPIIEVIDGG